MPFLLHYKRDPEIESFKTTIEIPCPLQNSRIFVTMLGTFWIQTQVHIFSIRFRDVENLVEINVRATVHRWHL